MLSLLTFNSFHHTLYETSSKNILINYFGGRNLESKKAGLSFGLKGFGQVLREFVLGSPNVGVIRTELDGILHLGVRIPGLFGQNSMDLALGSPNTEVIRTELGGFAFGCPNPELIRTELDGSCTRSPNPGVIRTELGGFAFGCPNPEIIRTELDGGSSQVHIIV
jgi:hypothetical protein